MPTATLTHEYTPRGSARDIFADRSGEILVEGPAGTGKSRAIMEKLNAAALKYPGMRGLIVRKTQRSLTTTALVTWKRDVIPELIDGGVVEFYGGSAEEPAQYRYQNGSKIMVGGMDNPRKIMSSEYDLIYAQEATELTEDDWEHLTTRLRSDVLPYQQLIADCNPDVFTHWLKSRCRDGKTVNYLSRHEDNPVLFTDDGKVTSKGADYIAKLDALTGTRYLRLRRGEWASAEGVIFEQWDSAVHMVDPFEVPPSWDRFWSVDFGFTNPFVCQFWAEDPDGRLWLYREVYHTQRTTDRHARDILDVVAPDGEWIEPRPRRVICDHDPEAQAVLRRELGVPIEDANKDVTNGLQAVMRRLKEAGDGKPRLFIMRDITIETDPELKDASLPTSTSEEIPGYVWKDHQFKEEPLKENDHGCDALRYMVMHRERDGSWVKRSGWI